MERVVQPTRFSVLVSSALVAALLTVMGSLAADETHVTDANQRLTTLRTTARNAKNTEDAKNAKTAKIAKPFPSNTRRLIWQPPLHLSWHWMIDHPLDLANPKDMGLSDPEGNALATPEPMMYDIDGEFNLASTVAALHVKGKKVICYVDVGAFESYRSDASRFPKSVRGKPDGHWDGSYWLDIRQRKILLPIMRARMQMCKAKGFDAVEPDEMDGYANDTGFDITYNDQLTYNRMIAKTAHELGLSVGLKGDIDQAPDLWSYFDWTLNEQCFQFDECDKLVSSFSIHGRAVFQVEYDDPYSNHRAETEAFCPFANRVNFNSMKVPLALNGGRLPCR